MKSASSLGIGQQDVTLGHSRIHCSRTWQWWDLMNLVTAGAVMLGPSVDLQDAFGISALESPETCSDTDTRRKATMMMAGDVYSYFWQDKGGFDYLRFIDDAEYGKGGPNGDYQSPTGANHVKEASLW